MCGINGIFAYGHFGLPPQRSELIKTRDYMKKRGPDGAGEWWSEDRQLGLGHRRLSILDLSERAGQPMVSACGRYIVVFNGEIYNYPELRRELEARGFVFRTNSDTEALLYLYSLRGENMLHNLRGMFALAIWDKNARTLFLARDPYGIKPLYIADDGSTFRWASQVKALVAGGHVALDPDPAGIVGFHVWGSVPEPFTLYRGVSCLPAGHFQFVDEKGPRSPRKYCSIAQFFADGANRPTSVEEVDSLVHLAVRDSVKAHLLSDVEVGIFLSAGIDSGAVLGLMRDAGQDMIRAITLSFEELRGSIEDEAPIAAEVARHYGAKQIVRRVSKAEFRADLPLILHAMDQPSIDGVNIWFVSKAAREAGLKVALSGLGGDELFAGYSSFRQIPRVIPWLKLLSSVPGADRAIHGALEFVGIGKRHPKALGLFRYGNSYPGAYLLRRALFMPFELETVLDPALIRAGLDQLDLMARLEASLTPTPSSPVSCVAVLESANYMRNQLLRDCDWAGMAQSLEIRTPLVDIDLLRKASHVTPQLTKENGKKALATAPSRPVPASVSERPKTGFSVPTDRWIASETDISRSPKGLVSRQWGREILAHAMG